MTDREELRISDVRSMRAMAHPLRMKIVGSLRLDGPATASMLARRLDTDSGQASFHLRQLARAGFVEDAPELGKGPRGRERWWRASQPTTNWDDLSELGPAGVAALRAFERAAHRVWAGMLSQYLAEVGRSEWSRAWTDAASSGDHEIRTTPAGLARLTRAIRALIQEHDLGDEAPANAEQAVILMHLFPRHQRP